MNIIVFTLNLSITILYKFTTFNVKLIIAFSMYFVNIPFDFGITCDPNGLRGTRQGVELLRPVWRLVERGGVLSVNNVKIYVLENRYFKKK